MSPSRQLAAALLAVFASASLAAAVTVVDTCGQVVQGGAVLQADLDCSAAAGDDAVVMNGGTLNLAGFTLTAPSSSEGRAVFCHETCRIIGPGTLRGGILAPPNPNLLVKVSDVDIVPAGTDVNYVIVSPGKVKLIRVTASGQTTGVWVGNKVKLIDSQLNGSGDIGVFETFPNVGIYFGKAILLRSTITGFAYTGIFTNQYVRLIDSDVTNNAMHPSCTQGCVDIMSGVAPRLRGTSSCGTSTQYLAGPTWGVCSND